MKKVQVFLIFLLILTGFTASISEGEVKSSNLKAISEENSAFAVDLYAKLKEEEGNLFFSPYSISTALAMTYAGARGNTGKQMADVLHFTLNQEMLHPAFFDLQAKMSAVQEKGNIELSIANALWAEKKYVFLKEYLELINENYGAALYHMDFINNHEAARKEINEWVEKKTKEKIKELLKPEQVSPATRLVLTNAIYFKGDWENQFKEENTKEEPFHVSLESSVNVPMMAQTEDFRYGEPDSLQVLELPYDGKDLSMIVLLPDKTKGLNELENMLSVENLNRWTASLGKREVELYLPKFKMTSRFELAATLKAMGMTEAFVYPIADFSGIDGTKELFISDVIHKAFVDVNEEGTEAAAATAVEMEVGCAPGEPESIAVFRADHPFLFLIRENSSGSILFIGRVVDPSS